MAREQPTTVYTEVQIDEDSISLTLISESGSNGAVIEDTQRYTFDELEDLTGQHETLRLSRESVNALEQGAVQDDMEQLLDEAEQMVAEDTGQEFVEEPTGEDPDGTVDTGLLPTTGEVLTDKNAPSWSDDDWVEVVEVLEDVSCDEYVIQSMNSQRENSVVSNVAFHEETVADANPSYDPSEPVVIGQYNGSGDEYAFPASRLI